MHIHISNPCSAAGAKEININTGDPSALGNGLLAQVGQVRVARIQKNARKNRQEYKGEETGDQKDRTLD